MYINVYMWNLEKWSRRDGYRSSLVGKELKRWEGVCVRKGSNTGSPSAEKKKAQRAF